LTKDLESPSAPGAANVKSDLQKLQGTWIPVQVEVGDEVVDKKALARLGRFVFEGNKLTFRDRRALADKAVATFTLDTDRTPAQMLLDINMGHSQVSMPYFYAFITDDELRIALASTFTNNDLLADFWTTKNGARALLTLRRQKKEPD
jgi:uncharacterized protein (TIGR03067 family)